MIWQPQSGQLVEVRYAKPFRQVAHYHGRLAFVRKVSRGPGPRNVEVEFPDGGIAVIPRGCLRSPRRERES